jgi:hypothetical protein
MSQHLYGIHIGVLLQFLYIDVKYNSFVRCGFSFVRQAFVFGGCLSPVPRPAVLRFKSAGGQGGLAEQMTKSLSRHIDIYKSFESLDNVLLT